MNTPPGILRYPKNTVLAKEGENTGGNMYILLQGEAAVYKYYQMPGQTFVETIGPSGYYGEASLFLNKEIPASIIAKTDVAVMAVSRKTALSVFARQPELAFSIMESIYRRLDAAMSSPLPRQAEAPSAKPVAGQGPLFPSGHGSYALPMNNSNSEALYVHEIACPVCGFKFNTLGVIVSRLRRESIDSELRAHYKDFEPLFYDVTSCPACFYSALTESFGEISKAVSQRLSVELSPYGQYLGDGIKTGTERDTFTVFAGYYLALACAPVCVDNYQLTRANLWQKLSRLYGDLGDESMCGYASQKALEEYMYSYQHFNVSEKQMQQICYIIGTLHQRLGDLDSARNFFFLAKSNRAGNSMIARQADIKLDEIRDIIKANK